jgi:uncharacterized membrane-anchored protein
MLFVVGTLIALGIPNLLILRGHRLLLTGEPLLLALEAYDTRAVMQGNYLSLTYPVLEARKFALPPRGLLAVKLDSHRVGTEIRLVENASEVSPGELPIRYRRCEDRLCAGASAFFFEEGQADYYRQAHYVELRIAPDGRVVVAGVRDADRNPLPGPP